MNLPTIPFEFSHNTVLAGYMGSISHNTYIPPGDEFSTDDVDLMIVQVGPQENYIGLNRWDGEQKQTGQFDICCYEIRKFVYLLIKSNPNVIGLLWLLPEMYLVRTGLGELLIQNRQMFSTKHAYKSFVGYAVAQMHKMFGGQYAGYMGAKRKEIFDRFGYDTKNAAHMIRLLRMGNEFLQTGELSVYRQDRDDLIQIKQGNWSRGRVEREGERLIGEMKDSCAKSKLPDNVDTFAAERLAMQIISQYHKWPIQELHD